MTRASTPQADGAETERELETSRQSGRVITPADIRRTLRDAGIACTTPDPRTSRIRGREEDK